MGYMSMARWYEYCHHEVMLVMVLVLALGLVVVMTPLQLKVIT